MVGSVLAYLAAKNDLKSPYWAVGVGILGLLWFVGPGILGGLAINKQQGQKGEPSPTRGIVLHLIVFSAGYMFLLLALGRALESAIPAAKDTIDSYIWLPIAALLGQNLGWALAPFFRRESCDRVLGLAATPAAPSASVTNTGPVTSTGFAGAVVQMPRREDSPATAGAAAAVGAGVVGAAAGAAAVAAASHLPQPNVEHAGKMLLKPTGDRLWATLGLLVSLASSAYAYHMGTLRRDPDISYNVVQYLQQDSGLRRDNIKVQSDDRIVTLTGNVDDEAAHQEAVRKALAVRGVRQIIDQIHVAPPPPASIVAPPGAEADAGGPGAGAPAAEINANVSIGGSAGKPAAESAAKPAPAKANAARSPAVAKANGAKAEGAKANAAKADDAKAEKPASHNPFSAVKNALTGSSANSKSATGAKTTRAAETATAENSTETKSKNPFKLLGNKIKKPKTGTTN